ncbi:hypothetical protein D7B24_009541 [Verticillium nonalfalfae]|uniref:U1-C C2H2-type zinc finger domain-containing protein n=1 Tax=Verticillium nonalfalfae TaxID=1051616 RepID=A0A3M9Y318_9PEZI|nr:uncharacterized protein D7B24_009541 [Verticillium nonalfalfae]RNJ54651.1 hypothetical protein D7B24_009541 [Verticillium nonalfalfae]
MSEYWKSTPKYWCKHCSVFVRDTKLERQNHEATGRHQGALKRSLRDIHRGHEREERDRERARREVDRLHGVVGGGAASSSASAAASSSASASSGQATAAQLARQREQLAEMGISVPTEVRGDMAMPGAWTVTNTRVVSASPRAGEAAAQVEAKAVGVRKREVTDEQREAEEEAAAVRGLFKKQRTWGGTRAMPQDDAELDALLRGGMPHAPPKKEESVEGEGKTEESAPHDMKSAGPPVKAEPADEGEGGIDPPRDSAPAIPDVGVKTEEGAGDGPAPVVFKKRKPKNIRQK